MRADGRAIGLIHIADPSEGMAPRDIVDALEAAAGHLGANVIRILAEDALRKSLQDTARGQRTLLVLGQAAEAVQRAHTPEEVYRTIGEQIMALGYHVAICDLAADGSALQLAYMTFGTTLVSAAERLTGLSAESYRFPLEPGSYFHHLIGEGRVVLGSPREGFVADALPRSLRSLADPLTRLLGFDRAIHAPMQTGDQIFGLLTIVGDGLSQADIPAMAVFANQAAIALENARLFEQVAAGRDRLRALSQRLVDAQEMERRRVARELHDQIGQILTGLNLLLEVSIRMPADLIESRLREAQALVEELMSRVDQMSLDLRPAMLDDLGLLPALLWHVERYTAHTGVKVQLEHSGLDRRFGPQIETAAYRIVQEGLTNVARHSGSHEAVVRLWCDGALLEVQVEDIGSGFDPGTVVGEGGLGGMRERAGLVGGKITIDSTLGGGTRLTAELPLATAGLAEA
jgi:signal transduction histidine kinase